MEPGKNREPEEGREPCVPILPESNGEKEVPYFIDEFTLSGGCCSDDP